MARKNKNQVTLTFAGDATALEKAFARVGSSAKEMSGDVGSTSKEMRNAGQSFDRARESADALDTKAMGFRDTMTGVQDSMRGAAQIAKGNLFEGFFTLGMGIGDLASGFANFLIPSIKGATRSMISNVTTTVRSTVANATHKVGLIASTVATRTMTVAQRALNLVMKANPILLIVSLLATLVGAIVLAYNKSETFRNIVKGAMDVARRAIGFVVDKGRDLLDFFVGLPGRLGRAFHGMFDGIRDAFRSAINFVIDGWNGLSLTLPRVDTVFGSIGGWTLNTPNIPRLHSGGVVPGSPGQEVLTMLQAGERVTAAGASGGRTVIEIRSGGSALDDALVEILARAVRVRGGDVQLVLGSGSG